MSNTYKNSSKKKPDLEQESITPSAADGSESSSRELEEYGISISPINVLPDKEHLVRIDNDYGYGPALQAIPQLVNSIGMLQFTELPLYTITVHNTDIPIFKDSLWQKKNGTYLSNTKGVGNAFGPQGDIKAVDVANVRIGNIVSGAMAVAAVISSTYYLKKIHESINEITIVTKDILQFLERDKRARINADIATLSEITYELKYIMQNDALRAAYLERVMDIRRDARQNYLFYQDEMNANLTNLLVKKKRKDEEIAKTADQIINGYSYLMACLQIYALSQFLEIQLSEQTSSEYIDVIKERLLKLGNDFQNDIIFYKDHFGDETKKAISESLRKRYRKETIAAIVSGLGLPGMAIFLTAGIVADKGYQKTKKSANAVKSHIDQMRTDNVLEPVIVMMDRMQALYNEPIRMIIDGDDSYLYIE